MSIIDPKLLKQIEIGGGIEIKRNLQGLPVAYKGPHLPDWYDNYMECLKDNQNENRKVMLAKEGKNFQMQTPEQEKAFNKRLALSKQRKEKAELAAEMALQNK